MQLITVAVGILLIINGVVGYILAVQHGKPSPTALIPLGFGLPIAILGLLAYTDSLRKHTMHAAAALGLLGLIGALIRPVQALSQGQELSLDNAATQTQLIMAVVCAAFVAMCVNSFIVARKSQSTTSGSPST